MLEQRIGAALKPSTQNSENPIRPSASGFRSHWMLLFALLLVSVGAVGCTAVTVNPTNPQETVRPVQAEEAFDMRVVTTGLDNPLEILYGPDGYLWVTERTGKRVTRVNPEDGTKQVALTLPEAYQRANQDGVLGMALHPELLQGGGNDYVYLAFTHAADASTAGASTTGRGAAVERRVTIRRYTYDPESQTLIEPVDILADLPGSGDHNSGKFVFSADETLFYVIGDQGYNQFGSACMQILAQLFPTAAEVSAADWGKYPGKVLRLNLDGSIPDDNPTFNGVQSHIYSYGHRNVQGLVQGPEGQLYAAEHGPKSDDELNLIEAGKNYGWPHVAGFQDDQAYVYGNWSEASDCARLQYSDFEIPDSVPQEQESEWRDPEFTPPLYTFGTVPTGYDFEPDPCAPNYYICWPTVAPTGIEIYTAPAGGIPDWPTSLLVTALKTGTVYRLELDEAGSAIVGDAIPYFETINRYRDLVIHPDGRTFYVITDSGSSTQDAVGLPTNALANPGAILEFSYTGE